MKRVMIILFVVSLILLSGCVQQKGAMIACLDYAELQENLDTSNLVLAEYDYDSKTIMSSHFNLSKYQIDNKITHTSSCYGERNLVLVSKDYLVEKTTELTPTPGKELISGETPKSYTTWVEGLTNNPEITKQALRLGFKSIYKCRSDSHKEWHDFTFDNEIKMTIPNHENENWYCVAINSPSLIQQTSTY